MKKIDENYLTGTGWKKFDDDGDEFFGHDETGTILWKYDTEGHYIAEILVKDTKELESLLRFRGKKEKAEMRPELEKAVSEFADGHMDVDDLLDSVCEPGMEIPEKIAEKLRESKK